MNKKGNARSHGNPGHTFIKLSNQSKHLEVREGYWYRQSCKEALSNRTGELLIMFGAEESRFHFAGQAEPSNNVDMPLFSLQRTRCIPMDHPEKKLCGLPRKKDHAENTATSAHSSSTIRNVIRFVLPQYSSSSSSDSEKDSNTCDEDGEEEPSTSQTLSKDWWQSTQLSQQIPTPITKRVRLCKIGKTSVGKTTSSKEESEEDEIFFGKSNRVSLSARKLPPLKQRKAIYDEDESEDDIPPSSGLKTTPVNNIVNKRSLFQTKTKESKTYSNYLVIDVDDNSTTSEAEKENKHLGIDSIAHESCRKAFHESPSLTLQCAIASSARKNPISRRLSTSPFTKHNAIMPQNVTAKGDLHSKSHESSSPSTRLANELKSDPIDEFSDEDASRRLLFKPHAKTSSSYSRSRKRQSSPAKENTTCSARYKESRANPFGISEPRQSTKSYESYAHQNADDKSTRKIRSLSIIEAKDSVYENNDRISHRTGEALPRPWANNVTYRLRAATAQQSTNYLDALEKTNRRSLPDDSSDSSGTSEVDIIDMTDDHSDGSGYNPPRPARTRRVRQKLSPVDLDPASSIFHRNDLFGGSGCGTGGVRILEGERSKPKSGSRQNSIATEKKKSSASAKGSRKKGRVKNRKRGGPTGSWGKGNKKYSKRQNSTSTRSVWSNREGNVGSYTSGRSHADTYKDVGLADVGGASVTF